jgi:hypothetical protein
VEHNSHDLTYGVKVLSSDGRVVHNADIRVPAEAPDTADTLIVFSLPLEKGTYTLRATIDRDEISKTFYAPNCSGETHNT